MKEYMLLIRNRGDAKKYLTESEHLAFIKQCEVYITHLKNQKQLIAAQPLIREGLIVSRSENRWLETPIADNKEVQVGYYHILANNMDEAMYIAKNNPEFKFVSSATIEVRPIKTMEKETGFKYPGEEK